MFREKLLNAKSKDRRGKEGIGGRYAVYDVEYELESGEGTRNKITFISWIPDDSPQYVSSRIMPQRSSEMNLSLLTTTSSASHA